MQQVVSAIIRDGNRIIVQEHNKYEMLTIPIGAVESAEGIHDAIRRELKEELGVTDIVISGHYKVEDDVYNTINHIFSIKLNEDWVNAEPEKHSWMGYMTFEEIRNYEGKCGNALNSAMRILGELKDE